MGAHRCSVGLRQDLPVDWSANGTEHAGTREAGSLRGNTTEVILSQECSVRVPARPSTSENGVQIAPRCRTTTRAGWKRIENDSLSDLPPE